MSVNTNSTTRQPVAKAISEFNIFSVTDFPAAVAGVITLDTGVYYIKEAFSMSDRFEIAASATIQFISDNLSYAITYTGTGIWMSNVSGTRATDVRINSMTINFSGVGAQIFDLNTGNWTLRVVRMISQAASQIIGTVLGDTSVIAILGNLAVNYTGFTVGLTVDDCTVFAIDGLSLSSSFATSNTMFTIGDNITQVDIMNANLALGASEIAFDIDPALSGIGSVHDITLSVAGTFYKTGTTGTITAWADATVAAEAITSVTDSSDIARFVFSAPPTLFVGQEVVISGFSTNTAYNGTFIITVVGAGFFEVSSIAFGTNETGSFLSNSVTVTDSEHGLSELQTLLISDTIDYNNGATIYNALTNTFQINRTFVTTESVGTWDTGSLTENDKRIRASGNSGQPDSAFAGEFISLAFNDTTTIPAVGANVIMNASGFTGDELSRFTIVDNGVATFIGLEDTIIKFDGNITVEPAMSNKTIAARFVGCPAPKTTVTFTNGTNIINETSTPLSDGDNIIFKGTAGTLPAELLETVVYFVVSKATNTFQVSYTEGGSAIAFTDDGTPTNTYRNCEIHGALAKLPIASGAARNLVPQALKCLKQNEEVFIVLINLTDAVDIDTEDAYYRVGG